MALIPGEHNITIIRDKLFKQSFEFKDSDNAIISLTGVTAARAMGRETLESGTAEWSVSLGSGITVDGAAGKVTIELSTTITSALVTPGVWALELTGYPETGEPCDALEGRYAITLSAVR